MSAWATMRVRRPNRPPMNRPSTVANAMMPRPPISTSASMMPWPAGDQYVPVSTVARPVTVTADADVKNAGMKPAEPSPDLANGSSRRIVPIRISVRNVSGNRRTGCAIAAGMRRLRGRGTR